MATPSAALPRSSHFDIETVSAYQCQSCHSGPPLIRLGRTSGESILDADRNVTRSVTFVVPCYNERENVANTITEIGAAADDAGISAYDILVVDDGSSDGTAAHVAILAQQNPRVTLISNAQNLGFGGAYKEGAKRARGTYVIMVPGDNAYPRDGITSILRKAGEADIVIPYFGKPEARSWQRRLASRGFTLAVNALFRLDVPYFNGPVLHKTRLLQQIDIGTDGFAYQAEALVKLIKTGATYCGVPVKVTERSAGRSSAFSPKNVYRVFTAVFQLWREVYRTSLDATKVFHPSPTSSLSEKLD
jgi:glycosyltransferase involved in cell wall biosynthesis